MGIFDRIKPTYVVPRRELSAADRQVAEHLQSIDLLLGDWVNLPKDWLPIDMLLDERLMLRPSDVMTSGWPS